MKQLVKNYSFSTSAKTVTLTDYSAILLERLQLIVDTTTNTILYNFADSTVSSATVATNVVTLAALAGTPSNSDKLQIIYDSKAGDPVYDAGELSVELTDSTNTANIVAGDTGFNGIATASATKTYTFTTITSGAQTLLDNTPTEGYAWIEVVYTSVGSGLAVNGNWTTASGSSYVTGSSWTAMGSATAPGNIGTTNSTVYISPIRGNFFHLGVSALTSGTFAGTVTLRAAPVTGNTAFVNASQSGTWTVGSNSATGSAVPANAFYVAGNSGGNLTAFSATGNFSSDAQTFSSGFPTSQYIYNGTNYDRTRSANAATGTTGTGLLGAGVLGFDGTDWQYAGIDANHNIKNTIRDAAGNARGANVDANNALLVDPGTATGATAPANALQIGGTDGTDLRALSTSSGGVLNVNIDGATSAVGVYAISNLGVNVASALPLGTNGIGTVGTTPAVVNVGQKTVSTTAVQVSATSTVPTNGIIIRALSTNAASIFVGGSGVTTSTGYELVAGESVSFTCNLNTLYIISVASTTDKICWNVE